MRGRLTRSVVDPAALAKNASRSLAVTERQKKEGKTRSSPEPKNKAWLGTEKVISGEAAGD